MTVTTAAVAAATTGFSVIFRDAYARIAGNSGFQQWADEITLSDKTTTFPIKGKTSRFREWNGSRIAREYQVYGYTLTAKKWEDTLKVAAEDIEDDRLGLYNSNFTDFGEAAGYLPYDQVVAALIAGTSQLCYDGQYFFDTDHPKDPFNSGAGTQVNLTTSSATLTAANLHTQITAMTQLTDEFGNLLRIKPTHIMVPQNLEKTCDEIIGEPTILVYDATAQSSYAAAPGNAMRGKLQKIVLPELDGSDTTAWYLLDLSKPVKPLFWGWKVRPQLQPPSMNEEHTFNKDEFVWGARARGAAGYCLWQLARKMDP